MPERYTSRIIRILTRPEYQPLKRRALSHALSVPDAMYEVFCQSLKQLDKQGRIHIDQGKHVRLPDFPSRLVGRYQSTSKGYGFVLPEDRFAQGDVRIDFGDSLNAVMGDIVEVRVLKQGRRGGQMRYGGVVTKIVKRVESQFVGRLDRKGGHWTVEPDGAKGFGPISVGDPGAKNAKIGDKVLVDILSYPTSSRQARGVILEKLGKSGSDTAELKGIVQRYGLRGKFPRAALACSRESAERFERDRRKKFKGREDIRSQTILTIDPVDSRDFDDAISLRHLSGGHWQLGVHIADVSHFVEPENGLDEEALKRGTSVYLPGHVIPMLPEHLSNGICSLQEGEDRYVKSATIHLDAKGRVLSTRFTNSVMRSSKRLTYGQVDDILAGKKRGIEEKIVHLIKKMEELAKVIQRRRRKAGMLSLDLPKAELVFGEHGKVIDVRTESTSFSHTMIEMFMVEANEAVARLLDGLNVWFLRRVHPEPDAIAKGNTAQIIKQCGYALPKGIDRKGIQQLLESVRGKKESFVINLAVLKSLQRAEYSPAPIGHFALASEYYCHFTSPIRRYPDLLVHRLVQDYLDGKIKTNGTEAYNDYAEQEKLGRWCSDQERNAEAAENELREMKILQLLEKHIGEEMEGVVTSVVNFGLFVQLEKYLIDGLIKPDDIPDESARKRKEKRHRPRTEHRGRRRKFIDTCPYKIGQRIRVRIANINVGAGNLDLAPAGG